MIRLTDQQLMSILNERLLVEDKINQYIYLADMPTRFGFGYNSFLVGVKDGVFAPGSYLYILYVDTKGHSIPVSATKFEENALIRCYLYCDDSYSVGFGRFMICGTLVSDANGAEIPKQWMGQINIKYVTNIYLNPYEKTPSSLRFSARPKITVFSNQKQLYDYEITSSTQKFTVSSVRIDPNYNDYVCLEFDTGSMTNSVYYQKYLNYTVSNDILDVVDNTVIFSGSISKSGVLPNTGQFNGSLLVSNIDPPYINFRAGNIVINQGRLNLGSVSQSNISKLIGYNIDEFKLSGDTLRQSKYGYGEYSVYLQNVRQGINAPSIMLHDIDSTILPVQYVSKIQRADRFNIGTTFFSGSIVSIETQFYSQNFAITNTTSPVYGTYHNPLIKSTGKFPLQNLQEDKYYESYKITHSDAQFYLISDAATTMNNCYITNSYIRSVSGEAATFNYISASLYSKELITQQQIGQSSSYFSGSIAGTGTFYVRTSGSSIRLSEFTTSVYDKDAYIELEQDWVFTGQGYNANLQVQYFTGQIYSSSFVNIQKYLHSTHSGILFEKLLLVSKNLQFQFKTLEVVELNIPNGLTTYDTISILVNTPESGSVKVISSTPLSVEQSQKNNINISGYFNLTEELKNCVFSGYHQKSSGNFEIQKYELLTPSLTSVYEQVFNTPEVVIKNQDYTRVYIPIAFNTYKNYTSNQISYIIHSLLKGQNEAPTFEMTYYFRNQLSQPKFVANSEIIPLSIVISDVQSYSGDFSSLQIFYSETGNDNFQLLTTINIPSDTTFPLTKSVDLPALRFSGEAVNFKFKPKDALGRYCPQQYFAYHYNFPIDTQKNLDLQRTYNISYIGGASNGGLVSAVNNQTGNVYLTAKNIPYNNLVLPNVQSALDYLLANPGGGTGSGGSELYFSFDDPVLSYVIGQTKSNDSAITISWNYTPQVLQPTAQYFNLYYAQYPSQQNWISLATGSLDTTERFIQIEGQVTTSLKLQIGYLDAFNTTHTNSAYRFFRNYIKCGATASPAVCDTTFISGLTNSYLAHSYQSQYQLSAENSQYIYFACPQYMTSQYQPVFVANHIAGGVTKSDIIQYNNGNFIEDYCVYKSDNSNLGLVFLSVESNFPSSTNLLTTVGGTVGQYLPLIGGTIDGDIIVTGTVSSACFLGVSHNSISSIQGGTANQYYHLTHYQYDNKLHEIFISSSDPDPSSGSTGDIWYKI